MLTNGKLMDFREFKKNAENNLIVPGRITKPQVLRLMGETPQFRRVIPQTGLFSEIQKDPWAKENMTPLKGVPFTRFSGGKSLRQNGKVEAMKRLNMIPRSYDPSAPRVAWGTRQLPKFFPELSGFGEAPVGSGNNTSDSSPTRGSWGELWSTLTTIGGQFLSLEQQKTQREIEASKAAVAEAQARTAGVGVTQTLYQNLPLFALVGVGGLGLVLYMSKKKRRTL